MLGVYVTRSCIQCENQGQQTKIQVLTSSVCLTSASRSASRASLRSRSHLALPGTPLLLADVSSEAVGEYDREGPPEEIRFRVPSSSESECCDIDLLAGLDPIAWLRGSGSMCWSWVSYSRAAMAESPEFR